MTDPTRAKAEAICGCVWSGNVCKCDAIEAALLAAQAEVMLDAVEAIEAKALRDAARELRGTDTLGYTQIGLGPLVEWLERRAKEIEHG